MDRMELIQNAIDSNAFKTSDASAGYVNPEIWNTQVLKSEESALVVMQAAKVYNDLLNAPGDTLNITVGVEAAVAGALTETTAVSIDAFTYTQVVFTPTEYGAAYQITDKEARRSFFSLMEDVTTKLGYRLARKKENLAVTLLSASAGNAIVSNAVASSALASSDTIDYLDIIKAVAEIEADKFKVVGSGYLFVHPYQRKSLMSESTFSNFYQFGEKVAMNGEIGMIAGIRVLVADEIPTFTATTSYHAKALLVGTHRDGTPAFGIAVKANPRIETDRRAVDRVTDIVATEEYDIKMLYANAVCTIESYCK
jgi:N4-gp56 family major capsid protein